MLPLLPTNVRILTPMLHTLNMVFKEKAKESGQDAQPSDLQRPALSLLIPIRTDTTTTDPETSRPSTSDLDLSSQSLSKSSTDIPLSIIIPTRLDIISQYSSTPQTIPSNLTYHAALAYCQTPHHLKKTMHAIRKMVMHTHITEAIYARVYEASRNLHDKSLFHDFKWALPYPKPSLEIGQDNDIDRALSIAYPNDNPTGTRGFTHIRTNTIYLRESGINNQVYIQEVLKHEDYHPYSKLDYSILNNRPKVEGFNEIMKYADIQKDQIIGQSIKDQAT
jgi:hypothetical protein